MKIAWFSNSPWANTGYGVQTAEVLPRFKADGHEVASISNYGLAGAPLEWQGITCLPSGYETYSNDIAPSHISNWIENKGWGIVLYDVWTLKGQAWDEIPMAAWVPIDHDPVPPEVASYFTSSKAPRVAIAMSKFGKDRLEKAGVKDVLYAPHTVNTNLFTPDGPNMRKQFGIPEDVHVTMMNAANKGNPSRKSFPEMFAAWVMFAQKHEDAFLYLHTEIAGLANGLNLPRLLQHLKAPMDRIKIVPQYQYRAGIPLGEMPAVYRMADLLAAPSRGEGFCVPLVESQAVSVPVLVSSWSAQPELVGAGWKVGGQPEWNEYMQSWFLTPNVDEIVMALEESYRVKGDANETAKMRADARSLAEQYDTDKIYASHWRPVLADLESRMKPAENRQQRRAKRK
jgi:glycosyltransferase involved in cell wall biosynthesis